jgi:Domain of unknown function (DUF4395)
MAADGPTDAKSATRQLFSFPNPVNEISARLVASGVVVAQIMLGLLALAAFLESALGLCLGCKVFAVLMKIGIIPAEVCEQCNNIWARSSAA